VIGAGIWFAALAVTPGGLTLTGESSCPTIAEIERRVEEVGAPAQTAATAVRVSHIEGLVWLELLDAEGKVLAMRELPEKESYDDLAAAAAVIIATWQSDLNPRTSPGMELPRPAPVTTPAPAIAAQPAPPAAPPRPAFLGFGLLASTRASAQRPNMEGLVCVADVLLPDRAVPTQRVPRHL
jgi:hypothetical protein